MAEFIVFTEIDDGIINDVSLQALAVARDLAEEGDRVVCLAVGQGVGAQAQAVFAHGADEVHAADSDSLAGYVNRPYREIVTRWLGGRQADLMLFPGTTVGNDLAPSVAAELQWPCVLDADRVEKNGGGYMAKRIEFDRKVLSGFEPAKGCPMIVTVRDGIAEVPPAVDGSGSVTAVDCYLSAEAQTAQVIRREVAKKTVNLKEARIIVAGGAGVGTRENFALVQQLADALEAEVGATRAVVDAGWLPADHQIGQTGAVVRPDLYIACGISGAVQHRVGMLDSRQIVAINIDANAPIFRIAHYKLVGDLSTVIPRLIKLIKE